MTITSPNARESEREILAACFKSESANFDREAATKLVITETDAEMYTHPHFQKIYIALMEAVMDAGSGTVDWGQVRANIPEGSQARERLKKMIADPLPPVSQKWAEKHVKKLTDMYKCRKILEAQQSIAERAKVGDASAAFDDMMEAVFSLGRDRFSTGAQPLVNFAPEIHNDITARRNNDGVVGLKTGIAPLDYVFGGLQKKHLYYIGGRPGSRKSVVCGQAAFKVADDGGRVLMASPEMSAQQYTMRLACSFADVDYDIYNKGLYGDDVEKRLHDIVDMITSRDIIINEGGTQGTSSIRQDMIRYKPDLLVLDYTQLFQPTNPKDNEFIDLTKMSKELNGMKKDFAVPILAAVQLSRKVEEREDKRPIPSDIRMTGQFEQDADGIFMLYSERAYAKKDEFGDWYMQKKNPETGKNQTVMIDPTTLEFICAKNRNGSPEDMMCYVKPGEMYIRNSKDW